MPDYSLQWMEDFTLTVESSSKYKFLVREVSFFFHRHDQSRPCMLYFFELGYRSSLFKVFVLFFIVNSNYIIFTRIYVSCFQLYIMGFYVSLDLFSILRRQIKENYPQIPHKRFINLASKSNSSISCCETSSYGIQI